MKPYDLVHVTHEHNGTSWTALGEVISMPTPDGTIMVRTVPSDPTTMVEMSVKKLEPISMKWRWVHYAIILGKGQFPVDMLRHDNAVPANFTLELDERNGRTITKIKEDAVEYGDALVIACCTRGKTTKPWEIDRWRSFSWQVEPLTTLSIGERDPSKAATRTA